MLLTPHIWSPGQVGGNPDALATQGSKGSRGDVRQAPAATTAALAPNPPAATPAPSPAAAAAEPSPGLAPATLPPLPPLSSRSALLPVETIEVSRRAGLSGTLESQPEPLASRSARFFEVACRPATRIPAASQAGLPRLTRWFLRLLWRPAAFPIRRGRRFRKKLDRLHDGTLSVPVRTSHRSQEITMARLGLPGPCGGSIARQLPGPGPWLQAPGSSFRPSSSSKADRLDPGPAGRRPSTLRSSQQARTGPRRGCAAAGPLPT